jgi:hypothetical protein
MLGHHMQTQRARWELNQVEIYQVNIVVHESFVHQFHIRPEEFLYIHWLTVHLLVGQKNANLG